MELISVTDDFSIEYDAASWRLLKDEHRGAPLKTLVDFNGVGLLLHAELPCAQKLNRQQLPLQEIDKVSLGWEPRTQNWHLGLYVRQPHAGLMEQGDLIWCELTAWKPGQSESVLPDAKMAGEALARLLNKPFQLVEAERPQPEDADDLMPDMTQPSMQTNPLPIQKTIEPMPLPIMIGDWSLHASGDGLLMRPTRTWMMNHWFRILFFILGFVIFIVLGIGSLESGLAPVEPNWLPYVAFGMALLLIYSAADNLWRVINRQRIVVDQYQREVRSISGLMHTINWRVPFEQIDYLLISQAAPQPQGRRNREDPMQISLETWSHLYANDQFYLLGETSKVSGRSWDWEHLRRVAPLEKRTRLQLAAYDSPLHHAMSRMAALIGVEVYVDIR